MGRSLLARRFAVALTGAVALMGAGAATASAQLPTTDDPRATLTAGLDNAGTAAQGLSLLSHLNKPTGFSNPNNAGDLNFANSDMAFQGNYAFVGNFNGFNIYDISNPAAPTLKTSVLCPGGQGDLSVYGNLLFMSVEQDRATRDCETVSGTNPPANRFRGIRIFNISDIAAPAPVAAVETCRGSHTHTLVKGKDSADSVYIYVSGTAGVASAEQLAGCGAGNAASENPAQWRIDVIKVPLAAPQNAAVVNGPRLFKDDATGRLDGLQNDPQTTSHPSGNPSNWSPRPDTNSCHDITVYEELDLAAGACEGNGLLIDISDPANPKRIHAVADPLWAYWHGATFANDGKTVVFTDEWGGGTGARCRATDQASWGGNAIYDIVDRKLVFRSYYKLPVAQTAQENCVSHIPSIIPIRGRDIFVQAWYQGGASLVDFSDSANPKEIGYFDRGPISGTALVTGGFWSTYWYNGAIYGSEIARGLDVLDLTATDKISSNEIAQAKAVKTERLNVQSQEPFPVAYADGTVGGTVPATLSLSIAGTATFGAFTPGVDKNYTAGTTAKVISSAGDAALSYSDPGRLTNGAFALVEPLTVELSKSAWTAPVSNDEVGITFKQHIGANDPLRTGSYSKTLTFTLSTTNP